MPRLNVSTADKRRDAAVKRAAVRIASTATIHSGGVHDVQRVRRRVNGSMTHLQTTTFAVPLAEYAQQPTDFLIQNFADYPPEGKPTIAYQVNAGTHQEPGQKHIAVQVRRVGYPTLNIKMQGRRGEVSSPDRDLEGVQAVQGRNGLTLRYPDGLIARVPEEREVINRLGKATRRAVAIHHRFSRKARVLVPNWAMGYPIQITNQA